jgi:hypothetical protein
MEPLKFDNQKQLYDYMGNDKYELDDDKPGLCFAVEIRDNLWQKNKTTEDNIEVYFHVDARDGRAPSNGYSKDEKVYVQQVIPSTSYPAYDKYS